MIYHFDDFRNVKRFSKEVLQRYSGASTAAVSELEFPEENDPRDEFLASASTEELEQALDPDRKLSALDPVPADEGTPAEEPNPYLDFDLPHGDIAKLLGHGVRPKDAVDAGLTHVTSSEGASHLNRSDTGDFEGMMIPYGLLGPGIRHCRVILNRPVRLKTSKGRLVAVLQPVASTNHLYYVPGTTQGVLDDSNVPILLCDGELSALAALQLQKDGQPFVHPVGMGGAWGWRKTTAYEDRDGGETKIEKAPVVDIEEKIARKGRRIIVAFASDTGKGPESKGARPALVKFLKRLKATVTILEVPPGPFESCHDLGQWIAAAGAPAVAEEVQKLLDSASTSTSNWSLTRGYVETEDGLFWVNSETGNRTFLASPFKVLAATRQIDGRDWGRLLEVCTPDGGVQKFIIPMSEFAAGGTSLAEVLLARLSQTWTSFSHVVGRRSGVGAL